MDLASLSILSVADKHYLSEKLFKQRQSSAAPASHPSRAEVRQSQLAPAGREGWGWGERQGQQHCPWSGGQGSDTRLVACSSKNLFASIYIMWIEKGILKNEGWK